MRYNRLVIVISLTIIFFIAYYVPRVERFESSSDKLVTVKLQGGFGNQMFQTACMLGYAEKYGYKPVFVDEPRNAANHSDSKLGLRYFFPDVPVITHNVSWIDYRESDTDCYRYNIIPQLGDNVKLIGYFQTEKYFPTKYVIQYSPKNTGPSYDFNNMFFMHIRRGDYLHAGNGVHLINYDSYYQQCLNEFSRSNLCLVVSDDIEWCKRHLPKKYSSWKNWEFIDAKVSDADTLNYMVQCKRGGICANSSFSWWAAYFLHKLNNTAKICMPSAWHKNYEAVDVVPEWAIKINT